MQSDYKNLKFELTRVQEFISYNNNRELYKEIYATAYDNDIIQCLLLVYIENIHINNKEYIRKQLIKEYIKVMGIKDKNGIEVGDFI